MVIFLKLCLLDHIIYVSPLPIFIDMFSLNWRWRQIIKAKILKDNLSEGENSATLSLLEVVVHPVDQDEQDLGMDWTWFIYGSKTK
jgi:hypothetical protein